jgi:hypothetical protein
MPTSRAVSGDSPPSRPKWQRPRDGAAVRLDDLRRARHRRRAPLERLDPRQQFLGAERLGEVVVGARFQSPHFVVLRAPCREHQDRQARPRHAQLAAHLDTVDLGQHEVEQHQVESLLGAARERHLAVARAHHLVAGAGEQVLEPLTEHRLVFDQQDSHGDSRH